MGFVNGSKNGFTLVELISTIAIIAIVAILAVPNIIKVYYDARLNAFLDEAKTIYRNVETSYNSDFLEESIKVDRYCDSEASYVKKLRISKSNDIAYDIELSDGEIIKFYVVNDKYQLLLSGNPVKISDIEASNIQELDNFEYDCNGNYGIYCNINNLPCIVVPSFDYTVVNDNNL